MKKIFSIFLILFIFCSFAFAQSSSNEIFRKIDGAFRMKDISLLKEVINENRFNTNYGAIESYILKSARDMLISNELDFAAESTLALIDANMDNFDAVELYTSIEKSIAEREKERLAEEQKRQLEEFKKQAVEEKTKDNIKKEYKTITNTASGETVFLDQDYNMRFQSVSWGGYMGLANVGVVIDDGNVSPKYGLAILGNCIYRADSFSVGGEVLADILLMPFGGYQNIITSLKGTAVAAFNRIYRNLFFRLGYSSYFTKVDETSDAKTVLPVKFMGPTLGIGFKDIKMGNFLCDVYGDYNFGHLFYKNVNSSFEVGLNFLLFLADLNKVNVFMNFGLADALAITGEGLHNQTKITVSIGVGKNE